MLDPDDELLPEALPACGEFDPPGRAATAVVVCGALVGLLLLADRLALAAVRAWIGPGVRGCSAAARLAWLSRGRAPGTRSAPTRSAPTRSAARVSARGGLGAVRADTVCPCRAPGFCSSGELTAAVLSALVMAATAITCDVEAAALAAPPTQELSACGMLVSASHRLSARRPEYWLWKA